MKNGIICVLHVLYKLDRGGLESRIMDIYRKLDRNRFQFDFYIESGEQGEFDTEAADLGAEIYYSRARVAGRVPDFKAFARFLEKNFYTHVCAYNQWSGWYLKAAKEAGVRNRIACSVTSLENTGIKNRIKNIVKHRVHTYANYRIAVSEAAAQWLFGKDTCRKAEVRIIPNAIDSRAYAYDKDVRDSVRHELGIKDDLTVIHVGNIRKVKNHLFLIQIFARLCEKRENVQLVLIGDGDIRQLKKHAEMLNVAERIHFLGRRNDVARLLQAGDVFVFPSLYEGFPGAVLEAEAAGLSCLVSDTVTDEVIMSGKAKRLSLNLGADKWADEILNISSGGREDAWKQIRKAGYDAGLVTGRIEQFLEKTGKDKMPGLHKRLKQMLDELTAFLEQNGIRYFLGYGTLLGAARHHDMIPWDDDIDLMMFRKDYDKLLRLYQEKKMPGHIVISSAETDPLCANLFAKAIFKEEKDIEFKSFFTHPDGLCIDIFPLYESESSKSVSQVLLWKRIKALRRAVISKKKLCSAKIREPLWKTAARIVYQIPFLPFQDQKLMKRALELCRTNEGKGLGCVIDYGSVYKMEKVIMPEKYWKDTAKLPLGRRRYCVPKEYRKVLAHIYGAQWHKIPPNKLRYQHSSLKLE